MPASAAAGAPNVPVTSFDISFGSASGMAPAAHIACYKALWSMQGVGVTGAMTDVYAAIDRAVADGVDVISISLQGPYSSYISDLPLLNAAKVGHECDGRGWDPHGCRPPAEGLW